MRHGHGYPCRMPPSDNARGVQPGPLTVQAEIQQVGGASLKVLPAFSTNGFSGKSRRPREMPLRAKDDETPAPRKFTLERAEGSSLPCRHQTRHRCHPAPRGSLFLDPDRLAQSPRRRELSAVGARLSAETGLPYLQPPTGEQVAGTYRQSLTLTSGRFAHDRQRSGLPARPVAAAVGEATRPACLRLGEGWRRDRMGDGSEARHRILGENECRIVERSEHRALSPSMSDLRPC